MQSALNERLTGIGPGAAALQQALGPAMARIFGAIEHQRFARHAKSVDDLSGQRRESGNF